MTIADDRDHGGCVDAWMERSAKGLPTDRLIEAFERAFAALWGRAHRTLGDVTLTAIVDRALYTATESHPVLSPLEVDVSGLRFDGLRAGAGTVDRDQLARGIRFVLVEFLTVLGNLTAEILTPSLHAALAAVGGEDGGAVEQKAEDGEDAKS